MMRAPVPGTSCWRGLLAPVALVLLAQADVLPAAHAGVVVLENGEVIVGRIREAEDTQEELIVRWPYKEHTHEGEMHVPKFRIRWYDRDVDLPSDDYWEAFENEHIDSRYHGLRERWRLRKKAAEEDMGDLLVVPEAFSDRGLKLSPIPVENEDFKIQKPEGWSSRVDDGITIFLSDKSGTDGFRPRIHVFSVAAAIGQTEDQIKWIERSIAKLADTGGFKVQEKKRLKPRADGFDQEMLTATTRHDRKVFALRKISFRRNKTYFFTAYAHERDYSGLELLFKACMRALEIFEDRKAANGKNKG